MSKLKKLSNFSRNIEFSEKLKLNLRIYLMKQNSPIKNLFKMEKIKIRESCVFIIAL